MQLTTISLRLDKNKTAQTKLRQSLAVATAGLLGISSLAKTEENPWQVETAGLFYSESNSRVSAFEPVISAKKNFGEEKSLSLKLALDSLTGATPTGALPSDQIQTFTRPSGNGSYTTQPKELPLDDTFKDTRLAFSANWLQPLTRTLKGGIGSYFSREYDFTSLGINGNLSKDLNQRNTTLNAALGLEFDFIEPEGNIPTPFAAMQPQGNTQPRDGKNDHKTILDTLFGITQIINRRTLMQFNYSISRAEGYLSDPFKILSVVDESTGLLAPTNTYRFENRPKKRTKQSLYWRTKYRFDRDMLDFSYRYMWDTWDITSHTIDIRYRLNFLANHSIEPHLRLYQQSAANFYRPLLLDSDITNNRLPEFASADLRLTKFNGLTLGAKYVHRLSNNRKWHLRLEWYQQNGDSAPEGLIGAAQNQDVFPRLTAFIFQAGYSFEW